MKILLVNCKSRRCGVYEFGLSLWKCLDLANDNGGEHEYFYLETDDYVSVELIQTIADVVIWNYHELTMTWLNSDYTSKIPSGLLIHDSIYPWPKVGYIFSDPTAIEANRDLRINRPILPPLNQSSSVIPNSIGSFGFGFSNKGFEDLVKRVNDEYEQAIIRLNIPHNDSVDGNGINSKLTAQRCFSLAKPGIQCYITHDWLDDEALLEWLGQNEVNAFLYKDNPSKGLASCVDWAIRARRPIAVSDLQMFRHIHGIVPPNESLKEAIKQGNHRLAGIYEDWTPETIHRDFERIIPKIIGFYNA